MKKLLFLIVLLVLVGCNRDIQPGEYIVIPLNQTVTPEVIHYSDSSGEYTIYYGTTPTPTGHPTTAPTPTPTTIPTVEPTVDFPTPTQEVGLVCTVRSNTNVNFRSLPVVRTDTFIKTIPEGQTYVADARYNAGTQKWFRLNVDGVVGWAVDLYFDPQTGLCTDLGVVDPF